MQIGEIGGAQEDQVDAEQDQVGDQRPVLLLDDLHGDHDLVDDHDEKADVEKGDVQHHLQRFRFFFGRLLFGAHQTDGQADHLVELGHLQERADQVADEQKVLQVQVDLADLHLHFLTARSDDVLHRVLLVHDFGHFDLLELVERVLLVVGVQRVTRSPEQLVGYSGSRFASWEFFG